MSSLTKPPAGRRRKKGGQGNDPIDLAALGHEIRGPLAVLAGLIDLMPVDQPGPGHAPLPALMRLAAEQALAVAGDALSGRTRPEPAEIDPVAIATGVADLYSAVLAPTGRRVLVFADADAPARIVSDATRIRQVLINLVANALRADHGGDIVLRVGRDATPRRIAFAVEDRGCGLPDGFSVAAGRPGGESPGAGLGLWISSRIAASLGGELTLSPRQPEGTVASFSIQRALGLSRRPARRRPPQAAGEARDPHQPAAPAPLRVLAIDDSDVARMLMETILASFGLTALVAADGDAAVRLLTEGQPDVVVLDWTLHREKGDAVLDRLAAAAGGRLPPVIVTTAMSPAPNEPRAAGFLAKPFTPRELHAALTAAVAGEAGGLAKA